MKFSIKCFNFHVLISGKPFLEYISQSSERKVSLLSRASSLILSDKMNNINTIKKFEFKRTSLLDPGNNAPPYYTTKINSYVKDVPDFHHKKGQTP